MLSRARTIYLISPQRWDAPPVSKHHYARRLAAHGHRVYFIEPPRRDVRGITLTPGPHPGLTRVTYATLTPYRLKFHARPLFDALMRLEARRLRRAIGVAPDIVWDFDNAYQFASLAPFGARLAVFHPVDDLPPGRRGTKGAHLVLANAPRYLARLRLAASRAPAAARAPAHAVIPHGLAEPFIARAKAVCDDPAAAGHPVPDGERPPVVAMVGNLARPGIDWAAIDAMARRLPATRFVMVGPHGGDATTGAGAGDGPPDAVRARPNVVFAGAMSSAAILHLARRVDVWLMAYDGTRDRDGATNPHKLLEYLATGKAVVSNWVEAYAGRDLVAMPPTLDNTPLPDLLAATLGRLAVVDAPAERIRRAAFTLSFSYDAHLARIGRLMAEACPRDEARSAIGGVVSERS